MLVWPQHLVEPQGAEGPLRKDRQAHPALGPQSLKDFKNCTFRIDAASNRVFPAGPRRRR